MHKIFYFLLAITIFHTACIAFEPTLQFYETTSKELKDKYHKVKLTLDLPFDTFSSPDLGPGYYKHSNSKLIVIEWYSGAERFIPFSSILSIDRPLQKASEGDNHLEKFFVFYKGPMNETEFFILVRNNKQKLPRKFIQEWENYLNTNKK